MKKLWVRKTSYDGDYGYTTKRTDKWHLGTVVGEADMSYMSSEASLQQIIEGPRIQKRYLIELDNGETVEAWSWDTYEPVENDKQDGNGDD